MFFFSLNRVAFTQEGNDYFVPLLTFLICPCLFFPSCHHLLQNQAKLFIEQKKIPFPVDNQNTNEELGKSACCSNAVQTPD